MTKADIMKLAKFDLVAADDEAILQGRFSSLVKPGVIKPDTSAFREGARWQLTRLLPLIEALADSNEKLLEALYSAKDVVDFCYMNQPKNKHQVEIEQALADHAARMEELRE